MSEPMTFEEFCLDLVGTCQHCDGTGSAARPLSTEARGCEVCNGRLCHEALEIPIARRLFAHLASTGVDVGAVLRGETVNHSAAREELYQAIEALASLRGSVADGAEWVDRADVLQLGMRAANALKRMAEERRDQAVQEREIAQAKARIAELERLVNKLEKSDG